VKRSNGSATPDVKHLDEPERGREGEERNKKRGFGWFVSQREFLDLCYEA
jgi:hypothetical protein